MYCSGGPYKIASSTFSNNAADYYGGVMFTTGGSIQIANSTFDHNLGSLYTFNNNLTFSGNVTFENCVKPPQANKTVAEDVFVLQEGGAVTSYQSTVTFIGVSTLLNNQARHGGAILAAESTVVMQG